jgi:tRNA dimethylallyltransferase
MDALYICGSTASGKSSAALTLAAALDGEIVNADAFQLYHGLETLTAAPTPEEKAQAPHHLYGVLDQDASADADAYRQLALPVLDDIRSRGKLPIGVGGSGLYSKFLTHGPSDLPPGNEALRKELDALSLDELNKRLAALDPATAATIDRHNPRYVQRALEICILSGQPVSELRQSFDHDPPHLAGLLLQWSPGDLDTRIRQRTAMMLNDGAIDEVAALPAEATSAAKAIGVPEIRALLSGDLTRNDCQERLVISTRQYAKRQRTWFRREKWLTNIDGPFTEEAILSRASHLT